MHDSASQGDALALAAGQRRAGIGEGGLDGLQRQARIGERDVLADRRSKQIRILSDDADLPTYRAGLQPGEVQAVVEASRP
jgi:hypothetical protein